MIALQYPDVTPKTRDGVSHKEVFDPVRKRWVRLSPEEWVRQQFILLLTTTHGYPLSLMAVEQSLLLGDLHQRADLLVYDRSQLPLMMVECKAETVVLSQMVLDQILRYNMSIPVRYLLITNGTQCMGWERDGLSMQALRKIPDFIV
ncbi:MAG: type I restriction enzyme HsdR N-terminal domain-containing protein [Sphingomonadales bacterium]